MIVEVDTDLQGCAELLAALARINLLDLRRLPAMRADLERRVRAGLIRYRTELIDTWSSLSAILDRTAYNEPIEADCEDLTGICAAFHVLSNPSLDVEVAITQPHGHGMAHAYVVLDGKVFDPSVKFGMRPPPDSFYLQPETGRVRVSR